MSDELLDALSPVLAEVGLTLVDVEVLQGLVRVTVDHEGGVDLEALAAANRAVSSTLDELDPFPGRYTLEVSSPGLERRLRTPEHFAAAIGSTVSIRTRPEAAQQRRVQGTLESVGATGIVVAGDEVPQGSISLGYEDIERARTVFVWGPEPKTAGGSNSRGGSDKGTKSKKGSGKKSGGSGASRAEKDGDGSAARRADIDATSHAPDDGSGGGKRKRVVTS